MKDINKISKKILDAAFAVHTALGPGLLESTYQACLVYELYARKLKFEQQVHLPVTYRQVKIEIGYRLDILVENAVIIELKATEKLLPIHKAQLLSYLKLSEKKLGLLINFNVELLKNGIHRMVNGL